jgi:hypothetical protein
MKDKESIKSLIEDVFKDVDDEVMDSLDATKEMMSDLSKFLNYDEIWEAASDDVSARGAIAAIIGTIALAMTDIGSPFIDFIMDVDEVESEEEDEDIPLDTPEKP